MKTLNTNVLEFYQKELKENKAIFEAGKDKILVSKNKPPIAGSISWARSIYQRVKSPILKFNKKKEAFDKKQLDDIIEEYLSFADQLTKYQLEKFDLWVKKVEEEAPKFLKNNILAVDLETGKYVVNFKNDFRVLISEAKYLDRMLPTSDKRREIFLVQEKEIYKKVEKANKKILNIALQEKEYYRNVDRLNKMLRDYYRIIDSLKDVEKYAL